MLNRAAGFGLAAAMGMALASCVSTSDPPTGDLTLDLNHRDPMVRSQAAIEAAEENRLDLVPQLLKNLRHPNGEVRLFTGAALRKLTGQDFSYKPYGTALDQEEAIDKYQTWWEKHKVAGEPVEHPQSANENSAAEKAFLPSEEGRPVPGIGPRASKANADAADLKEANQP